MIAKERSISQRQKQINIKKKYSHSYKHGNSITK